MPKYKYTAVDVNGKNVSGTLYAGNLSEFNAMLKQNNQFCLSVKEVADDVATQTKVASSAIKLKDISILCKQFSTMLNAGITIVKSLDVLYQQAEKEKLKQVLLKIYEKVQIGKGLSEAMREVEGAFPEFMMSMIEAGEMSGSLDKVMDRLALHYEKEVKLKSKVSSAMVYPIILCVVGFSVVMGLFTFVMPNLKSMFDMDNVPGITKFLFGMSDFMVNNWPIAVIAVIAVIVGISFLKILKPVQIFIDRVKVTMPVVGKLYVKILAASFCRTMSSVFSSGMSLITSIELTSNCLNNKYVTSQMDQVIDEIRTGGALSVAINKTEIFPQMMITMLNVGEESGALDEILEKTSDFYDQEADDAIGKLVAMMEPAMIIVLGGLVGLIAIGIMAPIFGMYQNIG